MKKILEATRLLSHDALKLYLYIVFAVGVEDVFDVEELGIADIKGAFKEIQKYDHILKRNVCEKNKEVH